MHRPVLRVIWSDPDSSATGYVVVDRLIARIATGGLRMRAGCTLAEVGGGAPIDSVAEGDALGCEAVASGGGVRDFGNTMAAKDAPRTTPTAIQLSRRAASPRVT